MCTKERIEEDCKSLGVGNSFVSPVRDHQEYILVKQAGFVAHYSEGDHTLWRMVDISASVW